MYELNPIIKTISPKKLVGLNVQVNLMNDEVSALWKNFMPRRKEILNQISHDLISVAIYDNHYFNNFQADRMFTRWAAVEVDDWKEIPTQMETFALDTGLYAIFHYKGLSTDSSIFQTIFGSWLPQSIYELDQRPHLEILGENYRNNDPESEEEIWIPIKLK